MPLTPITNEELETIRSIAPWIKLLGTGTLLSLVIGLWKVFGLYQRLEDVEKYTRELKELKLLGESRHEEITAANNTSIESRIERSIHSLHLKWLEEMQSVKDEISKIQQTQCHVLGEIKQLSRTLSGKDNNN